MSRLPVRILLSLISVGALFLSFAASAPQDNERPLHKTSYRVINVHAHFDAPNEEALKAELEVMDRVGIVSEVNLDVGRSDGNLPAWIELRKKHPGRFVLFAKFTLKDFARIKEEGFFEELVRELEREAKLGIQGVKIWKDLGMYIRDGSGALLKIDDLRLDPFWTKCGELGLPVLIHTADPKEYWYPLTYNSLHYGARSEGDQHYRNPEMPRWEELILQRNRVLAKHPKTTFIGAHFGSMTFELQQLAETLDRFPNFHIECAARLRILGRLNPQAVRDFFAKYQDRILFGTDGGILLAGRKAGASKNITVYPVGDPDWVRVDPADADAVRRWKEKQALFYSRYFEYFETDRLDLVDPSGFAPESLRLRGAKLPAEVLEKFYHANAERLIPGLRPNGEKR
jgi:predicted TIM-barrel fold metal-dependent hydrolase